MAKHRRHEFLRKVGLFADCNDDELDRIGSLFSPVDVAAGTVLTREGAAGRQFIVIAEGLAEVTRGTHVLGRLGPGAFVGEMALLDPSPRSATVTAVTPVQVYVLNEGEFGALLSDAPSIAAKIRQAAAARRAVDESLVET